MSDKIEDILKVPEVSKKNKIRTEISYAALDFYIWFSNVFIIYTFFNLFIPEDIIKVDFILAVLINFLIQFLNYSTVDDITQRITRINHVNILKKIPNLYQYKRSIEIELIALPIVIRPILVYGLMWVFYELFY